MPININKIKNVSAVTKSAISRKSAQTLPNNPSEQGYSAEEIKRRFYQPILDAANSAIAEIDRVVNEMNISFGQVSDELDNFIDTTKITEAFKLELNNESWVKNEETGMYEVVISQEQHKISDYKEIGVDMFLLDGNGNYTHVNQFEVQLDCSVRCFHETNGAGYVSIYVKREGFIVGSTIVDADHVVGLAKVGRTNDYGDLDNKPNTELMTQNEIMISKMISGAQAVAKAGEAEKATSANYAQTSGSATHSNTSDASAKAEADQYGVNIHSSYAKQNGNYAGLRAGNATNADKAKADEDGVNIKTNYAKQNGSYANMSVGNATNATNATNAQTANKAVSDGNGANIANTYAKISGTYPNMSVGKATNAEKATQAERLTGTIDSKVTAVTQDVTDSSTKVSTTQHAHKVVEKQISFKSVTMTATLYAESANKDTITLYGYGIKVYSSTEDCYYWIGSLHGSREASGSRFNDVKRVDLKNIKMSGLGIRKIVSGGALAHKESDDDNNESGVLFDTEGIKNTSNSCSYYAEDPGTDWAFNEKSYILITNFIVQLSF